MTCDAAATVAAIRAAAAVVAEHKVGADQAGPRDRRRRPRREPGPRLLRRGHQARRGASRTTPGAVLKLVATTLISTVGGASGPLFGTAFLRASTAIGDAAELDGAAVAAALVAARDGVVARGKAEVGDKTMVDALTPAVSAARAAAESGGDARAVLAAAAAAATEGAAATIPLQARKGRASYLGERSIGHPDPGATSTAYLLGALAGTTTAGG